MRRPQNASRATRPEVSTSRSNSVVIRKPLSTKKVSTPR